jgi:hypothetical protein
MWSRAVAITPDTRSGRIELIAPLRHGLYLPTARFGQNLGITLRPVADRMAKVEPRQPFGKAPGAIRQGMIRPRILKENKSFRESEDRPGEFAFLLPL